MFVLFFSKLSMASLAAPQSSSEIVALNDISPALPPSKTSSSAPAVAESRVKQGKAE
jgi:hypothetical protein